MVYICSIYCTQSLVLYVYVVESLMGYETAGEREHLVAYGATTMYVLWIVLCPFGHYVVCSSSMDGFLLPLWYLQTLLFTQVW